MSDVLNCTGYRLRLPGIVAADGAWLADGGDKRYLDLESGVWCMALGHNNPRVTRAMTHQTGALGHAGFCYSHAIVEQAATALTAITGVPGAKSVFLSSGSEAIGLGLQICRHVTRKAMTLCLHDAYLGSFSSLTERKDGWYLFDWRDCATCPVRQECSRQCPKLQAIPDDISEFVFEPGSAAGFVRFPPRAMIANIADIVRGQGGKVMVNEVTTGIGRTGSWFGYDHYPIKPDVVAVGKGLGNGYPVSALVVDRDIGAKLEGGPFRYMQSHQNDPLGAAVAAAVIGEITDRGLIARASVLGKKFLGELTALGANEAVTEVRGRGLMFAVEFAEPAVGDRIYDQLLEAGYIVGNRGGMFRIDPPLIIEEADFQEFVRVFRGLLAQQ